MEKRKPTKEAGAKAIRAVVIDREPLCRTGIKTILQEITDIRICGEAADGAQALSIIREIRPDLATLEIDGNHAESIAFIKQVKRILPQIVLLIVSNRDELAFAEQMLRAGAGGYLHKREPIENIKKAVGLTLRGSVYVSELIATRIISKMAGRMSKATTTPDMLTGRELEVFELIGKGMGPIQISDFLKINKSTVETYRSRIRKKLRYQNAGELRAGAIEWNRASKR